MKALQLNVKAVTITESNSATALKSRAILRLVHTIEMFV